MTEREFTRMMEQYEGLVYTVCRQLVHDHHLAQDLAQETFLSVWTHAASCPDGADSRRSWICRIAVNKAKDHLKSAYARRTVATEAPADTAAAMAEALSAPTVAQQLEAKEENRAAHRRIGALAEPYRTVCALYFLYQLPAEDIAARLRRPVKTVHTQLYRAKQRMKKELCAC